jgi:hypothetical protein
MQLLGVQSGRTALDMPNPLLAMLAAAGGGAPTDSAAPR